MSTTTTTTTDLVKLLSVVPKRGGIIPLASPICNSARSTEDPRHGSCLCPFGPEASSRLDAFFKKLGNPQLTTVADLRALSDVKAAAVSAEPAPLSTKDWQEAWENTQTLGEWAKLMGRSEPPPSVLDKYFRVDFAGNVVSLLAASNAPSDWQRDHYFPRARGGLNVPENLWAVCKSANNTKRARVVHFSPFEELKMGIQAVQMFHGLSHGAIFHGVPVFDLILGFHVSAEGAKAPAARGFQKAMGICAQSAHAELKGFLEDLKNPPVPKELKLAVAPKPEWAFTKKMESAMSAWVNSQKMLPVPQRRLPALKDHVGKFLLAAKKGEKPSKELFMIEFAYFKNPEQVEALWDALEKLLKEELEK